MVNSQYVKASLIINKIAELEELRLESKDYPHITQRIDSQIFILKEILKPQ